MDDDEDEKLKQRTDRELHYLSLNDKLRFAALIVLGAPLLLLLNFYFVTRVINVFDHGEDSGVLAIAGFAAIIGIAVLGADYWLLKWLKDEFDVFRWIGSTKKK